MCSRFNILSIANDIEYLTDHFINKFLKTFPTRKITDGIPEYVYIMHKKEVKICKTIQNFTEFSVFFQTDMMTDIKNFGNKELVLASNESAFNLIFNAFLTEIKKTPHTFFNRIFYHIQKLCQNPLFDSNIIQIVNDFLKPVFVIKSVMQEYDGKFLKIYIKGIYLGKKHTIIFYNDEFKHTSNETDSEKLNIEQIDWYDNSMRNKYSIEFLGEIYMKNNNNTHLDYNFQDLVNDID